ncbi:hypothetical protein [Phormidium nigroviride]
MTVEADLATYDGVETLYSKIKETNRPVEAIAIDAGVGVGGEFVRICARHPTACFECGLTLNL